MNNNMLSLFANNHTRVHPVTVTGGQITVDNAVNAPLDACVISGNSVLQADWAGQEGLSNQVQTVQGNNILDTYKWIRRSLATNGWPSTLNPGDVVCMPDGVGKFKFHGWAQSVADNSWIIKNLLPSTTYYIKGTITLNQAHSVEYDTLYSLTKGLVLYSDVAGYNAVSLSGNGTAISLSEGQTLTVNNIFTTPSNLLDSAANYKILGYSERWLNSAESPGYSTITFSDLIISKVNVPYEPFIPNSPSPDYPSAITSSIPAGTYKVACPTGGWWVLPLDDDLRGIGDYKDKIELDTLIGKGKLRRSIYRRELKGTESWNETATSNQVQTIRCSVDIASAGTILINRYMITHFKYNTVSYIDEECSYVSAYYIALRVNRSRLTTDDLAGFKDWIAAQYAAGTPVTVDYVRATELVTPLTLTHVDSSDLPELTLPSLGITAPASGYPFTSVDSEGGVLTTSSPSGQSSLITLPKLAKLLDVPDTLEYAGNGVWTKSKKVSDWIELTGDRSWVSNSYTGHHLFRTSDATPAVLNSEQTFGFDGSSIPHVDTWGGGEEAQATLNSRYLMISNEHTGFSDALVPTNSEIKAHFYGWKMCHADGASPYYKSEVPYTPSTWAEWSNITGAQTLTKDISGLTITTTNTSDWGKVGINTSIKPSTKYGILYNIVSFNLTPGLLLGSEVSYYQLIPKIAGNNKYVFTSNSIITTNRFTFQYRDTTSLVGEYVKFKDIRIYELPTGSQIESDFATLTADQLSAKYPFQGLCTKNWKHVTDGLGQTSVLPTASYDGYTPYKMRYQLAEPEVSEVELGIPVTAQGTNVITTENSNPKPDLSITAKCLGV